MDTRIKNWVGIALVATLFIGAISSLWYVRAFSQSIEPSSFRSFSVSAEGKAVAIPDVAEFSFTVLTQGGTDLAALQQTNTQKTNDAIAFVKSKEVADKDIKTQNYTVEPRYQYFNCDSPSARLPYDDISPETVIRECPPPEIVGYTVRNTVSVKVRNFNEVGGILSGVVSNGANSVSGIYFTVDDPTAVENEARAEAIVKAKDKAEALADAGDFRLGRLLNISEGGGVIPYYDKRMAVAQEFDGDMAVVPAPSIEPGSQDFQITMTLTYEIR